MTWGQSWTRVSGTTAWYPSRLSQGPDTVGFPFASFQLLYIGCVDVQYIHGKGLCFSSNDYLPHGKKWWRMQHRISGRGFSVTFFTVLSKKINKGIKPQKCQNMTDTKCGIVQYCFFHSCMGYMAVHMVRLRPHSHTQWERCGRWKNMVCRLQVCLSHRQSVCMWVNAIQNHSTSDKTCICDNVLNGTPSHTAQHHTEK